MGYKYTTDKGKKGEDYVEVKRSNGSCKARCDDMDDCKGFELKLNTDHCELWKVKPEFTLGSGLLTDEQAQNFRCYTKESTFNIPSLPKKGTYQKCYKDKCNGEDIKLWRKPKGCCAWGGGACDTCVQPYEGSTFFLKNVQSGRCVHTIGDGAKKGEEMHYWDGCSGDKNGFKEVDAGQGKFYLKNVKTGKCVHSEQRGAKKNSKLVWWDGCSGDKNQFTKVDAGQGKFYLKNVKTGRCVHTKDSSAKQGGKMVFWDGCSGAKNVFTKVSAVSGPSVAAAGI